MANTTIQYNIRWKPKYTLEAKTKSQLMAKILPNKIFAYSYGGSGFSFNGYTLNTIQRRDAIQNVYFYICWKHKNKWFAEVYVIGSDNTLFESIKQGLRDFEYIPKPNVSVKLQTNRMY
jgi:hypothetical protein